VDDNVDGAESLGEIVALMGHDVRLAHDGPTGIRVIREFDPDLVLLDIGLPGMNGYEVARQLKRDLEIRAVLVALSGYGREQDRALSREAGFAQHYVKPMDYRTLEAVLNAL
jgi:DNA-binding response OmpR family regulator